VVCLGSAISAIAVDTRSAPPGTTATSRPRPTILTAAAHADRASRPGEEAHRRHHHLRRRDRQIFHARVEGGFRQIIRHGASTKSYWWEVIDKAGTRIVSSAARPRATVRSPRRRFSSNAGDLFEWALVENPRSAQQTRSATSTSLATSVGLRERAASRARRCIPGPTIRYTFEDGAHSAPYDVTFLREDRPDVLIDGRGGSSTSRPSGCAASRSTSRASSCAPGSSRTPRARSTRACSHRSSIRRVEPPVPGQRASLRVLRRDPRGPRRRTSAFKGFASAASWGVGGDHVERTPPCPGPAHGTPRNGEASVLGGSDALGAGAHLYSGSPRSLRRSRTRSASRPGQELVVGREARPPRHQWRWLARQVFQSGGGIAYRLNRSGPAGPGGQQFSGAVLPVPGLPVARRACVLDAVLRLRGLPDRGEPDLQRREHVQPTRTSTSLTSTAMACRTSSSLGTILFNTHTAAGAGVRAQRQRGNAAADRDRRGQPQRPRAGLQRARRAEKRAATSRSSTRSGAGPRRMTGRSRSPARRVCARAARRATACASRFSSIRPSSWSASDRGPATRPPGPRSNVSASPVHAGDRLYFFLPDLGARRRATTTSSTGIRFIAYTGFPALRRCEPAR